MKKIITTSIYIFLITATLFSDSNKFKKIKVNDPYRRTSSARIGDYPYPTNPMNDRARGYLLQGKINNAIGNHGTFIDWDDHPSGLWGEYAYLPSVAFLAGVPGFKATFNFDDWVSLDQIIDQEGFVKYSVWSSEDAYSAWFDGNDTNFVGVLFDAFEDDGRWEPDSISKKLAEGPESIDNISDAYQWVVDSENSRIIISSYGEINPSLSNSSIGFIYPWALRPKLKSREDQFDFYEYGSDQEEWTKDDRYLYYGANVAESWFSRTDPKYNTDWHATSKSRINSHNTNATVGDLFGNTYVTDDADTYPVLAHSEYSDTWPLKYDTETGLNKAFWPGWWSQDFNPYLPNCNGTRKDNDCWEEVPGRFISDMDVYLEFDDRWAHRGNNVNTNNEYEQTGYPMGLKVMSEAHSYGVSYAEDIMFVTVKVRNESGDWCAEDENGDAILDYDGNQQCGEGMIMPDGTKLNRGKGFDYSGVSLGFYMDADVLMGDKNGYNSGLHTNDDDFMKYYYEFFEVNGERLSVSMAMIGDYDGLSGVPGHALDVDPTSSPGNEFGVVATQILDSPKATREIDLDKDDITDIFPGEPLKMTDWHWFDWYSRPGVTRSEGNGGGCSAGDPGCPQARNKEEILYKIMTGDTTGLQADEKDWYFHTENPGTDLGIELNPHFDSLEGLKEEPAFLREPDGLDAVLVLSCGPFDLPVGREVPFSFCIIFGQNEDDLINNAKFAQVMYNSKYQGFTPPSKPKAHAVTDQGKVKLYWNDRAESALDVVTGYSDFEGYKIYKSLDDGQTWGNADDMIYDTDGIFVGWRPLAQYDLSAEQDSLHCSYSNNYDCEPELSRGHSISGQDPYYPWFSLGEDTGLDIIRLQEPYIVKGDTFTYMIEDYDVIDGMEYTYSVVAYDMGLEPPYSTVYNPIGNGEFQAVLDTNYSNPDKWASPDGYASIENSKGTTVLDKNYVQVYPGVTPQNDLRKIEVVPNPYIVRSNFKESEYSRLIRFTNLPQKCNIKIYTVTGEFVQLIDHENLTSGNAWWDLRSENNQVVAPGLYIYYVESDNGEEHIGKFAVIR